MIKKFTFLFISISGFFYNTAKAQPGITPQYPYIQTFDSLAPFQSIEGQYGWLNGNFFGIDPSTVSVYPSRGINSTQAMSTALNDFLTTDSILTPLIGDLTATSEISFYYRIVQPLPLSLPQTLSADGGLKLSILPYVGPVAEPEQEIYRISSANHSDTAGYRKITMPLSAFAGKTAYFKFSYYQGTAGDDYFIDIDSLVINQPLITAISPINNNNFLLHITEGNVINLTTTNSISNNSHVSVCDMNGKLLYTNRLKNFNTIDASQWNKGLYVIQVTGSETNFSKKIVIR